MGHILHIFPPEFCLWKQFCNSVSLIFACKTTLFSCFARHKFQIYFALILNAHSFLRPTKKKKPCWIYDCIFIKLYIFTPASHTEKQTKYGSKGFFCTPPEMCVKYTAVPFRNRIFFLFTKKSNWIALDFALKPTWKTPFTALSLASHLFNKELKLYLTTIRYWSDAA